MQVRDTPDTALEDAEARLQQVVDNTPALIYAKDREGRLLFVNREFERLTGFPAREIVGRTDSDLFAPDLAVRFRRNDLRVLLEGRAIEFEESGDFEAAIGRSSPPSFRCAMRTVRSTGSAACRRTSPSASGSRMP